MEDRTVAANHSDMTRTGQAAEYTETGSPHVLRLVDKPIRDPGPGELRIRVSRSGVNPTDWKSRQGNHPGQRLDRPQIPGQDGSGIVDAVGSGVGSALHGLRVWMWEAAHDRPDGTAAEFTIIPARQVVPLPDGASDDLGASLGVPFITAHRCLTITETGPQRLGPGTLTGRVVLVAGGAGAVGNAAIQLAHWSSATVVATVSSAEKAQLAAAAGANHVIDYKQEDVVAEVGKITPRGVDTIVEVSPARNAAVDVAVLAPLGSVAIYANNGGDEFSLPVRPLMAPNTRWQFVLLYTVPTHVKVTAAEDVAAAVLDNAVHTGREFGLPLHHFTLAQAADAQTAVQQGAIGKVLIDVLDPTGR
jgi:NADPH2:quinone reductase